MNSPPQFFFGTGKSTLWTNAGQDRNFQRTLSAIGPYQFRGKFVWTNHWSIPFPGKFVWTNGPESSSKVSPCTGIGPWMALPSGNFYGNSLRHRFFCNSHALLGESRGYCTKTKQEWPDAGSMLENIFCSFTNLIPRRIFFVLQKFWC